MVSLGTKLEIVNANKMKIFIGADDYILASRKEMDFQSQQIRFATGAGPVYFTSLSNDRLLLEFAYTTGEVGNSVPANWDEMFKRNAASGEVPENTFSIQLTDRQGTPVTKTHTMLCKANRLRVFGGAEGETVASLELQIIDNEPSVS